MFAALLLAVAPGPDVNPVASLPEAAAFGVDGPTARAMWRVACQHPNSMRAEVVGWNSARAAAAWESEIEWRRSVYDKLDDVFYHRCSNAQRLRSLARLRELLGDDAFFRGKLPDPIPQYRR